MDVHHHHSDRNFCGTTEAPRRFSPNQSEITCPRCRNGRAEIGAAKIVVLTTPDGTACHETVLFDHEDSAALRTMIEGRYCTGAVDSPVPGSWCDASGNDAFQYIAA